MSFRLRLAFWIGGVALVSVTFLVVAALAVHGRTHYDRLDATLVDDADHFLSLVVAAADSSSPSSQQQLSSSTSAQVFGAEGQVLAASPPIVGEPPLNPLEVIEKNDGPAYGSPWSWIPTGGGAGDGWFATTRDPDTGDRVRVYVRDVDRVPGDVSYVETWTSLSNLDESVRRFRYLMFGLGAASISVALLGSVIAARQVLNPISTMTRTARAIAASRGFSRRVPVRNEQDEMGQLGQTLNEMLQSLEDTYLVQQQFVADAAHELRTPLTSIRGNIHVLARLDSTEPGDGNSEESIRASERKEAIAYLESEAARMSQMVDELLTLARADAGHTLDAQLVELDAVLLSAVAELSVVFGGRSVTVNELEPVQVVGDELRLKQFIIILLDNALKYTSDDGVVAVSLGSVSDEAVLSVEDTGIGIAADDIPHLFERFYRSDAGRARYPGGTGLGLSIARWVVDAHDGDISIESTLGQGTTVTVRLPLASDSRLNSLATPDD